MRGPSSSHSAAALRIGRIARGLLGGSHPPSSLIVEYDPNGSLVTTHDGQGSDMGLFGGLMGWDADDRRLPNYKQEEQKANMEVNIVYSSYDAPHPNTYKMTLTHPDGTTVRCSAVSTGGGMMTLGDVDGFEVNLRGDRYEYLAWVDDEDGIEAARAWASETVLSNSHASGHGDGNDIRVNFAASANPESVSLRQSVPVVGDEGGGGSGGGASNAPGLEEGKQRRDVSSPQGGGGGGGGEGLVHISTHRPLDPRLVDSLSSLPHVRRVAWIDPVMPVLDPGEGLNVPFLTAASMETFGKENALQPWELACLYEARRGGTSEDHVLDKMIGLVGVMRQCVEEGMRGTTYTDRILPCQNVGFAKALNEGKLIPGDVLNKAILYVSAIMEVKSSMGVIVAAPTAGSCGACPGTVLAVGDSMGSSEEELAKAFLVAGMVGVLVAEHATFAAEMGGCMAECGAGSGMAAAAITTLAGGGLDQALGASSLALQNSFGMTCDPVANRVEAPCLGKNVMAASNAISCANMAMAGYRHLIPLDEVLVAMKEVGEAIPHELRCTGKGGISATPTAQAIEEQLTGRAASSTRAAGSKDRPNGSSGKVAC